jgi:hypothetical protein
VVDGESPSNKKERVMREGYVDIETWDGTIIGDGGTTFIASGSTELI